MKKTKIIFTALFLAATILNAQNYEWAKSFGDTSYDVGQSISVDASGNVYTVGTFIGTVDFDPGTGTGNRTSIGGKDIFVQKMDASGNFLWAKSFGGTSDDYKCSVSVDASGNVYTTGNFTGIVDFDPGAGMANLTSAGIEDVFVQKMDASGNLLWAKRFGGTLGDVGNSISIDASGNTYTTGWFIGTVDFDPGAGTANLTGVGVDIFVQKMDASGNFLWAKSFGGTSQDIGYAISIDPSGNVYTTGYFQGTVDFDPGAGTANLTSAGSLHIFVQKMDASGNFLWAKSFGGVTSVSESYSITVDASGNVYTTGYLMGTVDFDPGAGTVNLTSAGYDDIFVQKMDASGNFLWAKSFGGIYDDNGLGIQIDPSGNVYTTGSFDGTVDFDPGAGTVNRTSIGGIDVFVQKMDASGNFLGVKTFGGIYTELSLDIHVDASGNIYTTGYFWGTVDLDPGAGMTNFISAGMQEIFVQKMSALEVDGYVFVDANGNGVKEVGEIPAQNQTISYSNGNSSVITNIDGFFGVGSPLGAQEFNLQLPSYYINTTPLSQNVNVQINVIDTLYFGIQPISIVNDLKVHIHPFSPPRPGFTRNYLLSYQNVGSTTLNNVTLKFLKTAEDSFVSATGTYIVSNDTIVWNLGTLQPFSLGSFTITNTLSASVFPGDSTQTQAWIIPDLADSTTQDNIHLLNELVIGSYDPNDKTVTPESSEPTENEPLEYTVRFQNTGNYHADFVIIKDTLDIYLDISTFQMITASHPFLMEIENRIATWSFSEINLPDSTTDEPGSHGFLKFSMKRVPGLGLGTQIPNKAAIYFDYNPPVITNVCVFSIVTTIGVDELGNSIQVVAYPNPTKGTVDVAFDHAVNNVELVLTDLHGKELYRQNYGILLNVNIELPNPTGIYFITIKTPEGQSTMKVVKE